MKNSKKVSEFPHLVKEWHPTKNGNLKPENVTYASHKKIWWKCNKNHEWETQIKSRSIGGNKCPYCSNQKVCKDNCLATIHPKLVKEWNYKRNKKLTPESITSGSQKKAWWIDKFGHEWQAVIGSRTVLNAGCPYCSGNKVCKDNCLEKLNPKLSKEWNYKKNRKLSPKDVGKGCHKSVWWICKKGHEWKSIIKSRYRGDGCPYCRGSKVCKDNCLETLNSKLSEEWDYKRNGKLTPKDVTLGSNKSVWWVCNKNHTWKSIINSRTISNNGCPYCAGKKVCKDNCLKVLNPELAKEWNYKRNNNLTPKDITIGSSKKVWWKCFKKGHEWKSSIGNRSSGRDCPICKESKGEKKIAEILDSHKIKYKIKYKRWYKIKKCRNKNSLPFDFKIKYNNKIYLIEYQGIQHYKPISFGSTKLFAAENNFVKIKKHDKIKKDFCYKNNISLLAIPYYKFDEIEKILLKFLRAN